MHMKYGSYLTGETLEGTLEAAGVEAGGTATVDQEVTAAQVV
jgi:hypothetical protein